MSYEMDDMVRASIEMKIIEAFKSTPELIEDLVKTSLKQDVNEYGGEPGYNDKKIPYLTFLARSAVQQVAREAVGEFFSEHNDKLKELVHEELNKGNVVDYFVKSLVDNASKTWNMTFNFVPNRDE